MRLYTLLAFAALVTASLPVEAQSLQETVITPEKAVPAVNQVLSGIWLSETRIAVPTGLQPPMPVFTTFFSDGTYLASTSNGTQTAVHGLWIRVGDRKFLGTAYYFSFNESRVLTVITKLRANFQLSSDGKTLTGTMEAVVLNRDGGVLGTFPGTTFSMIRLSQEIPGDFSEFQKLP
ncbi:MAG: hypothetical protein ACKV22_04735 [Bryobacteraceae bacterium]